MPATVRSVALLAQSTGVRPYFFRRLNALLGGTGLQRFRVAVAYARWDGIGLISRHLESFLDAGGEFQTIYGVANGITTPDSLLYALYLQQLYPGRHTYAGGISDAYANATFHPKFFEFKYAANTVAIVGSANLTGAGMSRNTEMGFEIDFPTGHPLQTHLDAAWSAMRAASNAVDLPLIRASKDHGGLGSETRKSETRSDKADKPRISTGVAASPKPLFKKVLGLDNPRKKASILAQLDTLTQRPERLYLEVLSYETGAQSAAHQGYQIQLPTATLGAYFGVGDQQKTQVTLRFPNDTLKVHLTHFENKTHRIRLRPLRDVPRPAIVRFDRAGQDTYNCTILIGKRYETALTKKCTHQTRQGARRWGLE